MLSRAAGTTRLVELRPTRAPEREPTTASHVDPCWRCGAAMEWRHATLQCPRCRFKIGCCEGLTGDCLEPLPR
jgi:hypothetical protein